MIRISKLLSGIPLNPSSSDAILDGSPPRRPARAQMTLLLKIAPPRGSPPAPSRRDPQRSPLGCPRVGSRQHHDRLFDQALECRDQFRAERSVDGTMIARQRYGHLGG